MTFIRIVPPAVLPLDLREAADNLGIDGTDSDVRLTVWLRGIVSTLEKRIRQCLIRQRWEGVLPGFAPSIELPHPVLAVLSIEYLDRGGQLQALPLSAVQVRRDEYQTILAPATGLCWPETARAADAVRITLECGYGDTPDAVPDDLKLYILAKLAEQFDPATGKEKESPQVSFIDNLLDPYRRYS